MTSFTVHCTHCETGFPVDPDKVPDGGVRPRCTNCEGIFFVAKPAEAPVEASAATPAGRTDVQDEPGPASEELSTEATTSAAIAEPPVDPDAVVVEPEEVDVEVDVAAGAEEDVSAEVEEDVEIETDSVLAEPDEPRAAMVTEPDVDDVGFGSFDDEVETLDAGSDLGTADTADSTVMAEEEDVAPVPTGFQFGKRDPHDKARRLARVLVSDMITYNPDRHAQALARGTLADDFEDEISKSWEEYVDQVGRDMAESTDYWTNALNDVLARGEKVF